MCITAGREDVLLSPLVEGAEALQSLHITSWYVCCTAPCAPQHTM